MRRPQRHSGNVKQLGKPPLSDVKGAQRIQPYQHTSAGYPVPSAETQLSTGTSGCLRGRCSRRGFTVVVADAEAVVALNSGQEPVSRGMSPEPQHLALLQLLHRVDGLDDDSVEDVASLDVAMLQAR